MGSYGRVTRSGLRVLHFACYDASQFDPAAVARLDFADLEPQAASLHLPGRTLNLGKKQRLLFERRLRHCYFPGRL